MKLILLVLILTTTSGCNYLIPEPIKRETFLIKLDVSTCIKEVDKIKKSNKSDNEKLKESNYKMLKTLTRIKPHTENLDNFTHGRK